MSSGDHPHRKKLRRLDIPGHARYLTFSCYRRLPLFNDDEIKQRFVDRLAVVQLEKSFELFAWVIMPEHVHLLILPDLSHQPVAKILQSIKRLVAERVIRRWRGLEADVLDRLRDRQGRTRFWQPGGGDDRNIFTLNELDEKIQYIHDNPLRRGLVSGRLIGCGHLPGGTQECGMVR